MQYYTPIVVRLKTHTTDYERYVGRLSLVVSFAHFGVEPPDLARVQCRGYTSVARDPADRPTRDRNHTRRVDPPL